jgi:DNA-binding XRE family transcriptional regulator
VLNLSKYENIKELSLFLDWCKEHNLKPNKGTVLKEYMKRRKYNMGYDFNLNKVKGLMAENDITQKDLAEKLGLSVTQTHKKITGQVEFKVNEMLALAEFLCVNPDVFFIPKVNENETKYTN